MSEEMRLIGQTALVTGGGRGIGGRIACELAANGCNVAVLARTTSQIEATATAINNEKGGRARAFTADVRNLDEVRRAVTGAEESLGPITLLVNNAGTAGPAGLDWEVDPGRWWECVESIVRGAFNCNRVVIPSMLASGSGRVINIASVTGTTAWPLVSATSAAKTALIRCTENLAAACGERQIAVFALHPGLVKTELLNSYRTNPDVAAYLDGLSAEAYSPTDLAARAVIKIATGELDALSGRFIDATTDLEALMSHDHTMMADEALTLRLLPLPTG